MKSLVIGLVSKLIVSNSYRVVELFFFRLQNFCQFFISLQKYHPYTSTLTKTRKPRSRDSKLYFLNYKSKSLLHEDYGPLTPWLQLSKSMKLEEIIEILEEADNNATSQTSQPSESCFDGPVSTDIDQQQKHTDDDDILNCCTTVTPDSEFTELSQSLDPESLECELYIYITHYVTVIYFIILFLR